MDDPSNTQPKASAPETHARTILLVDDEENILTSLRRLLRHDGYRIFAASSGEAGLDLLAQNEVDVIISDQRMPGMTGVDFLRQVKSIYPRSVRMVLSGYTELQSITDAINEGAIYKFLTKPWDDNLLRANIEEAFRYKEIADENVRLGLAVQSANMDLADANMKLLDALADKERRLSLNEYLLMIAQEVIQCVPFPVIGLDDEGMMVFANMDANKVLSRNGELLGLDAKDVLPEQLVDLLQRSDGDTVEWETETQLWRALLKRLNIQGIGATGFLILLFPIEKGL